MYAKFGKYCKLSGNIIFVSPPTVSWISDDTIIGTGNTLRLSVSTFGSAPITYQWRKGPIPISGQTSSFLTLTGITTASSGAYNCILTNSKGTVFSSDVNVTVYDSLSIVSQTSALSASIGSTAQLSVSVIGSDPITYKWYKSGVLTNGTGSNYFIYPVSSNDQTQYQCVISNLVSEVSSVFMPLSVI